MTRKKRTRAILPLGPSYSDLEAIERTDQRTPERPEERGLSGFLCEAGYPSCVHEALIEHDGELRLCLGPLARRAFPFRSGVVQDQI